MNEIQKITRLTKEIIAAATDMDKLEKLCFELEGVCTQLEQSIGSGQ